MESIYSETDYRKIIELSLKGGEPTRKRGAVARLARAMQCHSTLIAHIIRGKADLSPEQAVRASHHFSFSKHETDYFVTLVLWDRAGDTATKGFFLEKLEGLRREQGNLAKRWNLERKLSLEQEDMYYESWVVMAVHMATHLPSVKTLKDLSYILGVDPVKIEEIVQNLKRIGLVETTAEGLSPTEVVLHLGKGTRSLTRCHVNLRQKIIQDLVTREIKGTNYSSFVTLTHSDAEKIKEMITKQIEAVRKTVQKSEPEALYIHNVDFIGVSI